MKTCTPIFLLAFFFSCGTPSDKEETSSANDTIQTESGLSYYYLAKGEGPKVEKGSLVDTKLNLLIDDSVIWDSYSAKDSLFSFIVGVDGVIKGFEEMALLMREGDNVVAILPDSLAYGDEGSGDAVPPNATLVYDRYEMVKVGAPKAVMTDTLLSALELGGVEAVIDTYNNIINSEAKDQYHSDLSHTRALFTTLLDSEKYDEVDQLAEQFEALSDEEADKQTFGYYIIISNERKGNYGKALKTVNRFLEVEVDQPWLLSKQKEFQSKLDSLAQ